MADTKKGVVANIPKGKRQAKNAAAEDPFANARIRAVFDPEEADLVTSRVDEIQLTGATVTPANAVEGSIERIISVGGSPEVVGKGYATILQLIHNIPDVKEEETDQEGRPKMYQLRIILPAVFATPLSRKTYPLLDDIFRETSAEVNIYSSVLPLSTERLVIITGPIQSVQIAVQRISEYLQSSYEHYASIQNGAKPPVVQYVPLPVYGTLGAPENYDLPRVIQARMMTPQNPYGLDPKQPLVAPAQGQPQAGGAGQVFQGAPTQVQGPTVGGAQPMGIQAAVVGPGGQMTQQIFIPNDMVGAIIGKGGAKINEIRQLSGSHIKINEPLENSNERLVTITGTAECNQMALYLLYTRLETEKHRM